MSRSPDAREPAGRPGSQPPDLAAPEVHAAVDRVLLAHGEYAPLELLIELGRLDYGDYEAWRCGELASLDEALRGNRERIRRVLGEAARWAERRSLVPVEAKYRGWGRGAGRRLVVSPDAGLSRLMGTRFKRARPSRQLDIFDDSGEVVLVNALRAALDERQAERAAALLDDLARRYPDNDRRADAERLCDALAHLEQEAGGPPPAEELDSLRGLLVPAAERLLDAGARDFLSPFWRRLAGRLTGAAFDAARPELHASWVYAQCLDWKGVRASVLGCPGFDSQPCLLERLAQAERRLGARVPALAWLALLCWRFAERAESLLDADGFADTRVSRAWESFQDLELNPPAAVAWFPAWLLLSEPGLARVWGAPPPAGSGRAGRAFTALRTLLEGRGGADDRSEMPLRRDLQRAHPGFLELYLQRREGRYSDSATGPRSPTR